MKLCCRCHEQKPREAFFRAARNSDGLCGHCKACRTVPTDGARRQAAWKAANPDKYRASVARRDKDKLKAAHKRWRDKNIDRERQRTGDWSRNNPEKAAAKAAKRRATIKSSMPAWANEFFIREAYDIAKTRTRVTGVRWVVDHIVPLKGKTVCGLHVENNLQVITSQANAQKLNVWWPDMPGAEVVHVK